MSTIQPPTDYDHTFTDARALCHAVHGEDSSFGLVYMKRDPATKTIFDVEHSYGTFTEQESTLASHAAAGWEPYMVVAATSAPGHARNVVVESWAVAADFDDDGLPEVFESNELICPTFVIMTSPGRYHAVWVLDASCTRDQMQYLVTVIQDRFGGDAGFARINQTVRLPGFINHKNGHKVKLVQPRSLAKPYAYDFLCHAFDAPLVKNQQRTSNHRLDENLMILRHHHSNDDMIEDAKSALPFLSNLADDYSSWVKIGLSLAGLGDAGLSLFHEFSSKSDKYDQVETDRKWQSLVRASDTSSILPLFHAAQRAGWKNPGFRNQDTTANVLTDRKFGAVCAEVMHDEFAVIEHPSAKGLPQFLKLEDGGYRLLTDIEKRNEVEKVGKAVIAKLANDMTEAGFKSQSSQDKEKVSFLAWLLCHVLVGF